MEEIRIDPVRNERVIIIHMNEIYKQIDSLSYKFSQTSLADGQSSDNVASDSGDTLDGSILSRLVMTREAQVRRRLAFCLVEDEIQEASNIDPIDDKLTFNFSLPTAFKGSSLKSGAVFINDYLVHGALYDWYKEIGSPFAANLAPEVNVLESRIVDIFRTPSFVKRGGLPYHQSYKIR